MESILFAKAAVQTHLENKRYTFVNQTLHFSNELNNFIVCHLKLSFHDTIALILFKTPPRCFANVSHYTERQKKLITSLECHPLKSKASIWIIFGHRLGKFILYKHIAKNKSLPHNHRGDKCDEIARGQFSKNHRNCLPLELGARSRQKPVRRLRNAPLKFRIAIECSE